jgi:hypothetical protein
MLPTEARLGPAAAGTGAAPEREPGRVTHPSRGEAPGGCPGGGESGEVDG